jgi:hypothetical protein
MIDCIIPLVASLVFLFDYVVVDHARDQNLCDVFLGLINDLVSLNQEVVYLDRRLRRVALLN